MTQERFLNLPIGQYFPNTLYEYRFITEISSFIGQTGEDASTFIETTAETADDTVDNAVGVAVDNGENSTVEGMILGEVIR